MTDQELRLECLKIAIEQTGDFRIEQARELAKELYKWVNDGDGVSLQEYLTQKQNAE